MCWSKPSISVRSVSALDKIKSWAKDHRRRIIQLYAALLYNAHLRGFATGRIFTGGSKALCVPGLNCYSCPGATAACPLGALQNALAASAVRTPAYVLGILALFGLIFGRTICGWLCPFGLIQELLHKIPTPKIRKSRVTRVLSWLKYVLLALFVVVLPLFYALKDIPLPAFCKYICPAGTLEGAVALLAHPDNSGLFAMLGGLFSWKLTLMIAILIGCVFVYRAFCRFLCPLGAIYGLFAKYAFIGVTVDEPKCIGCDQCIRQCPMDIRRVGDHECIHCGQCAACCPTDAIRWKGPRMTKAVGWIAAAVLVLVLIFANFPGETKNIVGAEVGMTAPEFTVPVYGGETFTPAEGRLIVVNFWATWCTPCVAELPYFEQLALEYPQIDVIAIHSQLTTEDVPAWLADRAFDLTFALDETGEVLAAFDGSDMLPQTAIIAPDGTIVYNAVGSMTYDQLKVLVEGTME